MLWPMVDEALSLLFLPLSLHWSPQPFCISRGAPHGRFSSMDGQGGFFHLEPQRDGFARAPCEGIWRRKHPTHIPSAPPHTRGTLSPDPRESSPASLCLAPHGHSTANGIRLPAGHTLGLNQCLHHKLLFELFLQFNLPWFPGQQTGSRKSSKCLTHRFLET